MRVDLFHILARPQVPDSHRLVAGAAAEDRLMRRVEHGRVDRKIVHELLRRSRLEPLRGVPQGNGFVERATQHHPFVDVIPLHAVYFTLVTLANLHGRRRRVLQVPKFDGAITAG
jgi:hypothetical protein